MSGLEKWLRREREVTVGDDSESHTVTLRAPDTLLGTRLGVSYAPMLEIPEEPSPEQALGRLTALHDFHVELVRGCMSEPLDYVGTSQLIHRAGGLESELVRACSELAGLLPARDDAAEEAEEESVIPL